MTFLFELRDESVLISQWFGNSYTFWGVLPLETFHNDHNKPWYKELIQTKRTIVTVTIEVKL